MPLKIYPDFTAQEEGKTSFMRKKTIKLINNSEKLFSVYRRTNRLIDLDRYKLVRNQISSAICLDKVSEIKAKLLPFKESNKARYGYVRSKQKVHSRVAQLRKKDNNTLTGSDKEAANEMTSFFMSVFVNEGDTDGPEIDFVGISKPTNSMLDFNIGCLQEAQATEG